jgi:anti-sigma regulatory factor (Ser/Thr protein kinase)
MGEKKPTPAECVVSPDWDDSWESEITLVEHDDPEALEAILPLRDGAWPGERFHVPADLAYGTVVRRQIQGMATERSMSPEDTADLVLAVSEAFNNAIRHGTARTIDPVEFRVEIADGTASVALRYLGEPFAAGRPELPGDLSPNGRGRYIMSRLLDDVVYQFDPPWTVIRLTKRYRPFAKPQVPSAGR